MLSFKSWFKLISLLLLVWGFDFVSKMWAMDLVGSTNLGFVRLATHFNPGIASGIFSSFPEMLTIFISVLGIFILTIYFSVLYLVPMQSTKIRLGLTLLMGGILGNITDRAMHGQVLDFISFNIGGLRHYYFNLADIFQWPGFIILIKGIFWDNELIPKEGEQRQIFWVNKKFQLKYCLIHIVIAFFLSLIYLTFTTTFLRLVLIKHFEISSPQMNEFLVGFHLTFGLIFLTFCILLLYIGKFLSHRVAGPVYAFERFLRQISEGKEVELKLRKHDEFKHLEPLSKEIKDKIKALRE